MKNLRKKIVALGLGLAAMASSVMSLSASALEYDPVWQSYYVPYRGDFYADSSVVRVQNLKWTASQMEDIKDRNPLVPSPSIELEFRPASPVNDPHEIWAGKSTLSTNIPNGKFEFQADDYDDVTVVIPNIKSCTPEQGYYATQTMIPKSGGYTNVTYNFACELGSRSSIANDSWPIRKSFFSQTASFGHWYGWEHGGIHV